MEQVAQFVKSGSPRRALARLCRLACEATTDGRRLLDDWEKLHRDTPGALSDAIERLDEDSPSIDAPAISADPLLWLSALDEHCHRVISPDSYLTGAAIDDGKGKSQILPLYSGQGIGAKSRQYGNLAKWLVHHRAIPLDNPQGVPVAVTGIPHGYADWTERRTADDTVKIAVVHFIDGVTPAKADTEPTHFICSGLSDENQRFDSAMAHIRAAKADGAHILVMPELTVTSAIRSKITNMLRDTQADEGDDHRLSIPILVLGSFHESTKDGWCNRAIAVSGMDGALLFECDKRKSVTHTFPGEANPRKENIECAPTPVTCLFTPIGLIAMAICKDLFEGEPASVLASLPLDWLLVPSMSNSLGPHKTTAKNLHDTGGTVIALANQEMPHCRERHPGFVHDDKVEECQPGLHIATVRRTRPGASSAKSRPSPYRVK